MSIFINAYRRRSSDHEITVYDDDGVAVIFGAGDVFRVKIGRPGSTPILDLDSGGGASSTLTAANPTTLALHQNDLSSPDPAVYEIEASILDASDGNRIKAADQGVFVLHETQGGDIGI